MKAMRSRWFGSMLACTLNTKPETALSSGSTDAAVARLRARRRRVVGDDAEQLLHRVVAERAAEEHRRQVPLAESLEVELRIAGAGERHLLAEILQDRRAHMFGQSLVVRPGDLDSPVEGAAAPLRGGEQHVRLEVEGAEEIRAHADRPDHRRGVERQLRFDLVEQLEGMPALAVDLVDEGDDRDVAQPAHLEELSRLRLDALGGVDHHDGGIDRRQRAVGVLGKILVAGRVEQVEDEAVALEAHDGRGDRDAALALDRHPVGARAPPLAAGAHRAGHADGAAGQQQLLGQRRLAGVRVRDDREGAARAPVVRGLRHGSLGAQGRLGKGSLVGHDPDRCSRPRRGNAFCRCLPDVGEAPQLGAIGAIV